MSQTRCRYTTIKVLAYFHRYLFLIGIVALPFCFKKDFILLRIGIGFLTYSLYSLVGYLLQWKHIYCSYQNAYRRRMTPDNIVWSKIKKSDIYGTSLVFGILGVLLVLCQFVCG